MLILKFKIKYIEPLPRSCTPSEMICEDQEKNEKISCGESAYEQESGEATADVIVDFSYRNSTQSTNTGNCCKLKSGAQI